MNPNPASNFLFNHSACFWLVILLASVLAAPNAAAQQQPNIILINLDDCDFELLDPGNMAQRYPALHRFATDGIRFTNCHATTPRCGPSRASLLRGQYAHNTGIRINNPASINSNGFAGGMRLYQQLGYFENDLSTWMQSAGYRTMMVGKYLHHDTFDYVPAGWDDFYWYRGAEYFSVNRFTNENNPDGVAGRTPNGEYRTDLEAQDAVDLINRHAERNDGKPFFMYLNPLAPHLQTSTSAFGMVAPHYENWWTQAKPPRTADFDEKNMLDKSSVMANLLRLPQNRIDFADAFYRNRLVAMKSVDDMVQAIFDSLDANDMNQNTYLILTSDNGFQLGHQRLIGKGTAYQRASRIPLYVIGPNIPSGASANHLLAQIDFAPTLVELAGVPIPEFVDGKSFTELLSDPESVSAAAWRDSILIENWESKVFIGQEIHLMSTALRMFDSVYVQWAHGSSEYYDLAVDPLQLRNRFHQLQESQKNLFSSWLRASNMPSRPPQVTLAKPWEFNTIVSPHEKLFGMAEDDSAINRVVLVFRRFDNMHYWNGSSWQADYRRVDAQLTNPGKMNTTWRYDMPDVESTNVWLGVWVRSYDDLGFFDTKLPSNIFRVDVEPPETTILSPSSGQIVNQNVTIAGHSTDHRTVARMRLVIKSVDQALFWNGQDWQDDWTFHEFPVAEDGSWSYSLTCPPGTIYVGARGVDDSGNSPIVPAKRTFHVAN